MRCFVVRPARQRHAGGRVHRDGLNQGCFPLRPPSRGATVDWGPTESILLNPASLEANDWTIFLTWVPFMDSPWITSPSQHGQVQAFGSLAELRAETGTAGQELSEMLLKFTQQPTR